MNHRLLYLEDDWSLAQVTCRTLTRRGFEVTHVTSLAAMPSGSGFSHALLDMVLEDGSAVDAIPDLLAVNPALRIVLLTGYSSVASAVQAIKLGASDYLTKPATGAAIVCALLGERGDQEPEPQPLSLAHFEWEHINQVLRFHNGNISAAARQLGLHRRSLQRKLSKRPPLRAATERDQG